MRQSRLRGRTIYMRFVLLISLLAAASQGDPITVVETTSGIGETDLFYSDSVPTAPAPVTAYIRGDAGSFTNCVDCGDQPVTAGIDLAMDLYTDGPIREGVARLALEISSCCSPYVTARIGGAIGPYSLSSCAVELDCIIDGYFPFELGVPFTIDLSGMASDGGFSNSALLQLYELPPGGIGPIGAPVQILVAPEPSSAGFAVTGLSALVLLALIRRRKLQTLWQSTERIV